MPLLVVISGPTAAGKTALGIALATYFSTEIISADSRQFYTEMNIGTAKPSPSELLQVPHHFIDCRSVKDGDYSVGDYERDVIQLLEKLFNTYNIIFLVGGSGLYIKAVCEGLDSFPDVPDNIKEYLNTLYETQGIAALQTMLQQRDETYYNLVDKQNHVRLLRALGVSLASDQPFSSFRTGQKSTRPFKTLHISLAPPRELLYQNINQRTKQMFADGLVEEAKALLPFRELNALNTVGYKEIFDYFDHKTDLDAAMTLVSQNTRRYAKRQFTWFNRQEDAVFMAAAKVELCLRLIEDKLKEL